LTARYTPAAAADADAVIEALVVLSTPFASTDMDDVPAFFTPVNGPWRMRGKPLYHIIPSHPSIPFYPTQPLSIPFGSRIALPIVS
jgi:hypothetical protein